MKIEFNIDSEYLSERATAFLNASLNEATFKDEVKNEMAATGRSERSAIERLLTSRLKDSINGAVEDKVKEIVSSSDVKAQIVEITDSFLTPAE